MGQDIANNTSSNQINEDLPLAIPGFFVTREPFFIRETTTLTNRAGDN